MDERRYEDNEIIKELNAGRFRTALVMTCEVYGPDLHRFLRKKYGLQVADRQDVIGEVLLAMLRPGLYAPEKGSLIQLMYGIAKNKAADKLKEIGRAPRPIEREVAKDYSSDGDSKPNSCSSEIEAVKGFLANLSMIDQTILLASVDGGEWTEPLEREFNLTANNIRVRKHRLLRRLRDHLGNVSES